MDFPSAKLNSSIFISATKNHPAVESRVVGQDDDALGRMVVESPNGVGESQIGSGRWIFRCQKKRWKFLEAILDAQMVRFNR